MALAARDENRRVEFELCAATPALPRAGAAAREYPGWLLAERAERCFTLADFLLAKEIGSGKFGRVIKGKERSTGAHVVLKAISKADVLAEGVYRQLQREVETHSRLGHPNIIRLYAYFHDKANCYLVLEHAGGGNLYQRLFTQPKHRLDDATAARYVRQLSCALAFLHARRVIHRDLKPENVLLCIDAAGREVVKLADFGWCVTQRSNSRRTTLCGTPEYLPPELCGGGPGGGGEYGPGFDMYCVGVLLFEMLAGRTPFPYDGGELGDHMRRVAGGLARVRFPPAVSPGAAALARALMAADPAKRPTAPDVLAHPWVVGLAGATPEAEWNY